MQFCRENGELAKTTWKYKERDYGGNESGSDRTQ